MGDFAASNQEQEQRQSTTLPGVGGMEGVLRNNMYGLAGSQANSLQGQQAMQSALMNPSFYKDLLARPDRYGSGGATEQAMYGMLGNDLMDRFTQGGGTGKGLTPEEFQQYKNASSLFNSNDFGVQLQQKMDQNQLNTKAYSDLLNRQVNPYGLAPQEEQSIRDIYGNQAKQAEYQLNQFVQDNAATRGLNRSDTPVAGELARQAGLMYGNINSQMSSDLLNRGEANRMYGLNLTNSLTNQGNTQFQQQNMLNQMTPAAMNNLMAPLLQERMAQGTTTSFGKTTNNPSNLDLTMKGIGTLGSMVMGGLGAGGMMGMGPMAGFYGGLSNNFGKGGLGLSGSATS